MQRVDLTVAGRLALAFANAYDFVVPIFTSLNPVTSGLENRKCVVGRIHFENIVAVQPPQLKLSEPDVSWVSTVERNYFLLSFTSSLASCSLALWLACWTAAMNGAAEAGGATSPRRTLRKDSSLP
jgi:hypothetical protein